MDEPIDERRRQLCQLGALALATSVLPTLPACGGASGGGAIDAGPTSAIVVGDALFVQQPGNNIFVCHDASGFYAMSANCTHARCIVQFNDPQTGFLCPCHGSTFDFSGQHNTPPAPGPLPHFKLEITNGEIFVDPSVMVDPTTRAPG